MLVLLLNLRNISSILKPYRYKFGLRQPSTREKNIFQRNLKIHFNEFVVNDWVDGGLPDSTLLPLRNVLIPIFLVKHFNTNENPADFLPRTIFRTEIGTRLNRVFQVQTISDSSYSWVRYETDKDLGKVKGRRNYE